MREFIMIAAIVMMSTSSCYANLSLASKDPAPTAIEEQKAETPKARPARVTKAAHTRKLVRTRLSSGGTPIREFDQHSRGLATPSGWRGAAPVREPDQHCL